MSSTTEVMEFYSNACLPEASISSACSSTSEFLQSSLTHEKDSKTSTSEFLQSSLTHEKDSKNGSASVDSNSFSEPRDISYDGFDFNLVLNKLAEMEHSLNIEQEKNILLNNKLNKLQNRYYYKFKNLTSDIDDLYDDLNSIDSKVLQLDQYSRRESIVISGIDRNITQNNLEFTVLRILRTIGLFNVSSYEITACHRLYNKNNKYPPRTIVRFTNRKIVNFCILNRDKLIEHKKVLNMNLRFYEHLTDSNESVLKECIQLEKYKIIDSYFIRNGHVKIIINAGDKPLKIYHTGTLFDKFRDFYDHNSLEYIL